MSIYKSFYLANRVYIAGFVVVLVYVLSFYWPAAMELANLALLLIALLVVIDTVLLYSKTNAITASRKTAPRWSNGDENTVELKIQNSYPFSLRVTIIDEIPLQFQFTWQQALILPAASGQTLGYSLKPLIRGVYEYGNIIVLVSSPLRFVVRRYTLADKLQVKVYPSYIQLRRHALKATANELDTGGSRRLRKMGNSLEFEQIKEYVRGDDFRTINWKASARKADFMVNTYVDERSQQVYCLIDKSRHMKMPFHELSLLDYAINSALVLSNTVIHKHDKAGLISFGKTIDDIVVADRKAGQMEMIMEKLYQQTTDFQDADYELLYSTIRYRIKQRSLLVLFTNFETMAGLQRQMPYLSRLASHHLLCVIFFENTELHEVARKQAENTEDIYIQTIAEKMVFEKKQMVKTLQQAGIVAMLTAPQQLTANTINKYLEIKTKQMI